MKENQKMYKEKVQKQAKNSQKGITLIALVITIIVLLILAGVAISQITGNSSILQKAQNASDETIKAEELSSVQLAVAKVRANNVAGLGEVTNENNELADALNGIATITETNADNWKVKGNKTQGIYTIYKNGKVEAPTGTTVANTTPTEEPTPATVALTGITLTKNPDSNSIVAGNYVDITATLSPDNTTDTGVTFEITQTSEEGVVTLSNTTNLSTRVTGAKAGTATITVTGAQTTGVSTTYQVTVTNPTPVVTSVSTTRTVSENTNLSSTYNWEKLSQIAKAISSSSSVSSSTAEVTITEGTNTPYKIGVGDEATVYLGTSAKQVRIIGFHHDTLANGASAYGTGHEGTTAGITFEFKDILEQRRIHSSSTNVNGWGGIPVELRGILNGSSYRDNLYQTSGGTAMYSTTVANSIIKPVTKTYNKGNQGSTNDTCTDALWLLACSEIWPKDTSNNRWAYCYTNEGDQYKWYALKTSGKAYSSSNSNIVKKLQRLNCMVVASFSLLRRC